MDGTTRIDQENVLFVVKKYYTTDLQKHSGGKKVVNAGTVIIFYYYIHYLYLDTVYYIIQFVKLSDNISMFYKHNEMIDNRKYNVVVVLGSGCFTYIEYDYILIGDF